MRIRDFNMLQMLNAQERSEPEGREIISAADSNLELTRILISNSSEENFKINSKNNYGKHY